MTKDFYLRGIWFHVDTDAAQAMTVFPDDAVCYAVPQPGESAETFWHHDIMHTWLAQKMGKPCSPTLWDVAHERPATEIHYAEEGIVNAFIAFLRDAECRHNPDMYRLCEFGDLGDMRREALCLLGVD